MKVKSWGAPAAAASNPASDRAQGYPGLGGAWIVHGLIFLSLVAGTCLLYWGDLQLGFFQLDDPSYVANNPWIKEINPENLKRVFTTPLLANFSPVHLLTYMVDYAIAGNDPRAFHGSSNLWAGVVAGWVYLLGLVLLRADSVNPSPQPAANAPGRWAALRAECGRRELFAWLAALLFVAHPAHVEAVAWISSRKDLVAAAFALPALLAYFRYRRGKRAGVWYVVALILFTIGVAAKLSVLVLPAIFFVFDLFVQRRRGWGMVLDKAPFVLVVLLFAVPTMGAQPPTGHGFDLYVFGHSILHSLWLLSGLGSYVLARPRPAAEVALLVKIGCVILPTALAVVPWLLRRRIPGVPLALIYWVFLALVPSQVLSFIHPVADRYLFFPSVAAVLLLAWLGGRASMPRGRGGRILSPALLAGLVLLWGVRSWMYLREWQDPRSVWYAASRKSASFKVQEYLGAHYQDQADQLDLLLKGDEARRRQTVALARTFWRDEPRLEQLLAEWQRPANSPGPMTRGYEAALRRAATGHLERAWQGRGTILVPNICFRLGSLALLSRQLDRARTFFQLAYAQAQEQRFATTREELTVRSHHALGLVEWHAANYEAALKYLRQAEEEDRRFGKNYVPEARSQRENLERVIQSTR